MDRTAVALVVALAVGAVVAVADLIARRRASDQSQSSGWIAGGLYASRTDRRILVPKRYGIGRTLNLAHPAAWLVILVPLIAAVVSRLR